VAKERPIIRIGYRRSAYQQNFTTSAIGACRLPITDYEKLRFATPSSRPSYKRGQEADNDQKRTPQSLQTATPPTSHPLADTGPCTGRPARLMSATSLKFIAPGITADATSQSEFNRYLARHATLCSGGLEMPTTIEILHVSRSSICLFRPPPRCQSDNFRLRVGLLVSCARDLIQIVLT